MSEYMLGGWIALSLINIDCLYVYFIYRIQRKKQTLTSKIGMVIIILVWLLYSIRFFVSFMI